MDLPRPNVEITTNSDGESHIVISRDGKGKSYKIEGNNERDKIKDVVEKVINDKYTGEWLP